MCHPGQFKQPTIEGRFQLNHAPLRLTPSIADPKVLHVQGSLGGWAGKNVHSKMATLPITRVLLQCFCQGCLTFMEQDARLQAFMPLAKMPKTLYLAFLLHYATYYGTGREVLLAEPHKHRTKKQRCLPLHPEGLGERGLPALANQILRHSRRHSVRQSASWRSATIMRRQARNVLSAPPRGRIQRHQPSQSIA